jgi:hypothetical protein
MNASALLTGPPWWVKSLEKYGFAAILAAWLMNSVVDPFVKAHFQTMSAVEAGMDALRETTKQQVEATEAITDALSDQAETLEDIKDNTSVIQATAIFEQAQK